MQFDGSPDMGDFPDCFLFPPTYAGVAGSGAVCSAFIWVLGDLHSCPSLSGH